MMVWTSFSSFPTGAIVDAPLPCVGLAPPSLPLSGFDSLCRVHLSVGWFSSNSLDTYSRRFRATQLCLNAKWAFSPSPKSIKLYDLFYGKIVLTPTSRLFSVSPESQSFIKDADVVPSDKVLHRKTFSSSNRDGLLCLRSAAQSLPADGKSKLVFEVSVRDKKTDELIDSRAMVTVFVEGGELEWKPGTVLEQVQLYERDNVRQAHLDLILESGMECFSVVAPLGAGVIHIKVIGLCQECNTQIEAINAVDADNAATVSESQQGMDDGLFLQTKLTLKTGKSYEMYVNGHARAVLGGEVAPATQSFPKTDLSVNQGWTVKYLKGKE